jgi:nicotinamide mononucleotide adenylyltransferase
LLCDLYKEGFLSAVLMSTLGCIAKGLAPAEHRIRLCQLATQDSPFVMVDPWEATQSSYQRTLTVLSRVEAAVNSRTFAAEEKVRVMLLCGADLLESMTKPGVWIPEQVHCPFISFSLL